MREEEMAVNVAKQIYFDEFNTFYKIAETKNNVNSVDIYDEMCICHDITEEFMYRLNECNEYTREELNRERIIAIYNALRKIYGYFSDERIKCYIE